MRHIRELTRQGRYDQALTAAVALARTAPEHRETLYLVAVNQRCLNRIPEALVTLGELEKQHPRFSLLHQERGFCNVTLRDAPAAIQAFQQALHINPALPQSWSILEHLYRSGGELDKAAEAAGQLATLQQLPTEVVRAGSLFSDGELTAAENIIRSYVRERGAHSEALRLLARITHQTDRLDEAERLLEAALTLAPDYHAARADYTRVLLARQKYLRARLEVDTLLRLEPDNADYLSLCASACVGLGDHERSITLYQQLLATPAGSPALRLSLGHCLKAIGRQREAVEAYHEAVAAAPSFGDAYWSLANLKTYRFSLDGIARMRAEEAAPATEPTDRYHLCFALGKALEDRREYAESWRYYERGNALKRAASRYRPEVVEANTRTQIELYDASFFSARSGVGAPDRDPIFIVGLPRSGSTLLEQILASHPKVEGTHELAEIQRMAMDQPHYPARLHQLTPEDFQRLGAQYLTDTRVYRKSWRAPDALPSGDPPKAFFIDKMPNNFRHIALIHLMLPNATIIDVRREPIACCVSNLKQLFAGGQEFSYSAEHVARYYRTYLELMRHWDTVLPGRILRVFYEDLVQDLASSVRRILKFCDLEFAAACVEFHRTERDIHTPSSEQVRQPIFREGLDQWRNYEPSLGPLQQSLGDAVSRYRE